MTAPMTHPERRQSPTPLGALLRGVLAGAGGTGLMTAYQQLIQSGEGGNDDVPQTEAERWQQAPAPAQVGKRIIEGVFKREVSADRIPLLTTAMHWLYGTTQGGAYGLVQGTVRANPVASGLFFGAGVWGLSYLQLVPMGIYEPPWSYPAKTLAVDLSYHIVYGVGVAGTYEVAAQL